MLHVPLLHLEVLGLGPARHGLGWFTCFRTSSQSTLRSGRGRGRAHPEVSTEVSNLLMAQQGLRLPSGAGWLCQLHRGHQTHWERRLPPRESRRGAALTLLHEGAHSKPEAVEQSEVVLHHLGAGVAGVGIVPLIGAEPTRGESGSEAGLQGDREAHPCHQDGGFPNVSVGGSSTHRLTVLPQRQARGSWYHHSSCSLPRVPFSGYKSDSAALLKIKMHVPFNLAILQLIIHPRKKPRRNIKQNTGGCLSKRSL